MRTLTPDDLSDGMIVGVHSNRVPEAAHPWDDSDSRLESARLWQTCCGYPAVGLILEIQAIDHPLAVAAVVTPGGKRKGPFILDLRQTTLGQLSDEFLTAFASFSKRGRKR